MPTPRPSAALVEELWLPTGAASRMLGISQSTLKRYADRDGFLVEGTHWRPGAHHNSPRVWELHVRALRLRAALEPGAASPTTGCSDCPCMGASPREPGGGKWLQQQPGGPR